ncbi:MAG: UDP-N-acetylmuramoyl-L-alanine--D-glutamate ligase [Ruminococcaceae bacterium]|nr:UDP-N-acetylmuramoyl-L-alanine--D-glutamate ligase [Oscillospiraceae bacterium]
MSQITEYIKDKSVLILGFGREGQSTYNYIRKHLPEKELTIADKNKPTVNDSKVSVIFGDDYLKSLGDFDIVFKSPGIAFLDDVTYPDTTEITCQTDMFLRFCKPTVVGITGSKGKTTTSTLIYEMLKHGGVKTCLIGNIGVPVFEMADEDEDLVAVIEMSSHQLEFTTVSPHVAVLVNIYQEHLDHYKTGFRGYVDAKLNIAVHQNTEDYLIYNPEQELEGIVDWEKVIKGNRKPVTFTDAKNDAFVNELWKSTNHLKGEHNRQDIAYALTVARIFGVGDDAVREAIKNFGGIEHRMEYVGVVEDIIWYNDSIATIPTAVMGAVKALGNVDTLLFGGLDRGIDYSDFIEYLARCDIRNLVGLPETGHNIIKALKEKGADKSFFCARDMEDAVKKCAEITQKGKSCLFSPAAASYNYYKNFEEKGRHYKAVIHSLTK